MHKWKTKKSSGVWYVCWKEGKGTKRMSLQTKIAREADKLMRLPLSQIKARVRPTKAARTATVLDVALKWLDYKETGLRKLQPKTLTFYRGFIRSLGDLRSKPIRAVSFDDVERWRDQLWAEAPYQARAKLTQLSAVFGWCQIRHAQIAPANNIPLVVLKATPSPESKRTVPASQFLLSRILGELRADHNLKRAGLRDLANQLEIQWFSGIRCSEVCRLQWGDIDFPGQSWTIRNSKNKGGVKELPAHPRVLEIIASLPRPQDNAATIFAGSRITDLRWKRFKERFLVAKGFSRGSIRHAFITALRMDEKHVEAKELARHSSPSMQDLYTHGFTEQMKSALLDRPAI